MGPLDIAERPPLNGLGAYPDMREAPNTRGFTYYFLRITYKLLLITYYVLLITVYLFLITCYLLLIT